MSKMQYGDPIAKHRMLTVITICFLCTSKPKNKNAVIFYSPTCLSKPV